MFACLIVFLGGPDWGNIPPLEDEINAFLEKTNLKALSSAELGGGGSTLPPEATPPLAAVRAAGARAAGGPRQEPSKPPPQFMKRRPSIGGAASPTATAPTASTAGTVPGVAGISERRRSIQMTAGSLAVRKALRAFCHFSCWFRTLRPLGIATGTRQLTWHCVNQGSLGFGADIADVQINVSPTAGATVNEESGW